MKLIRHNPLLSLLSAQLILVVSVLLASPASAGHHGETKMNNGDVVDVAVSAGQFNTLAAALEAAGLVDTLKGDGPFTVFAPTDAAFAKLPDGTVEALLKPENKDQLIAILTYHVVAGRVTAAEVVLLDTATTVNGENVAIAANDSGVTINQARVVKADVQASNGVIHVIDEVILPPNG